MEFEYNFKITSLALHFFDADILSLSAIVSNKFSLQIC